MSGARDLSRVFRAGLWRRRAPSSRIESLFV